MTKIQINNQNICFSLENLPCFIHGKPHEGSSFLTISIAAQLFEEDKKLLILCGYPMAQEEFVKQVGRNDFSDSQAIFMLQTQSDRFIELIKELSDINERIIIIKNIELFKMDVFDAVKNLQKVIFSGNLDECIFGKELQLFPFKTKIFFSNPQGNKIASFPSLPKFSGYLVQSELKGIVHVQQ